MVREPVEMDPRDSDVCVQGSAFDKMNHSLSHLSLTQQNFALFKWQVVASPAAQAHP